MIEPFFFRPSNRSCWNSYAKRTVNWKERYVLNFFPWQFLSLSFSVMEMSQIWRKKPQMRRRKFLHDAAIIVENFSNRFQRTKTIMFNTLSVWHGGIMAIVLVSGLSGPASSTGQRHCVVLLSRTLYSHSTAYNPGVLNG